MSGVGRLRGDVHPTEVGQRVDGPLDAEDVPTQVGGVLVVEVPQVQVARGMSSAPNGRPSGHPDDVALDVGAALAVPVALA